jgi:hypothetical protein
MCGSKKKNNIDKRLRVLAVNKKQATQQRAKQAQGQTKPLPTSQDRAVTLHQGEYALTVKGVVAPLNAQLGVM